jgi:hypothetical protein
MKTLKQTLLLILILLSTAVQATPVSLEKVGTFEFLRYLSDNFGLGTSTPFAPLTVVGTSTQIGRFTMGPFYAIPTPSAFGTTNHLGMIAANENDIVGVTVANVNSGSMSGSAIFLSNNITATTGPGLLINNNMNMIYAGSNYNGVANGTPALKALEGALFVKGGALKLASVSATGSVEFYTGANSFNTVDSDAKIDFIGNFGIGYGSSSIPGRLAVKGTTTSAGIPFIVQNASNTQILTLTDAGLLTLPTSAGFTSVGNIRSDGDIFTTGAGDDIWLGTATQGSSLMRLFANGGVVGASSTMIGSTSAPLARLHVVGQAGNFMPLLIASSSGASMFEIESDGRIGVGTSSPMAMLDLYNNDIAGLYPSFRLGGNTGGDSDVFMGRFNDNDSVNDDSFRIGNGTSSASTSMFVLDLPTGFLGLGTTTPSTMLTVNGTTSATCFQVIGTGNCLTAGGGGSNQFTDLGTGLQPATTTYFVRADTLQASSTTGTSTFAGGIVVGSTATNLGGDLVVWSRAPSGTATQNASSGIKLTGQSLSNTNGGNGYGIYLQTNSTGNREITFSTPEGVAGNIAGITFAHQSGINSIQQKTPGGSIGSTPLQFLTPVNISNRLTIGTSNNSATGTLTIDTVTALASSSLHIKGVTSQTGALISTVNSVNSPVMYVMPTGFVGIGTSTPDRILNVTGDVAGGISTIERVTSATNQGAGTVFIKARSTGDMTDGFGPAFQFDIQDNASVSNTIADIRGLRSGADNSGRLAFSTMNAGAITEKMTILPNGNTGIGTSTPTSTLHVSGSNVGGDLTITNFNTSPNISVASLLAPAAVNSEAFFSVGNALTTNMSALYGLTGTSTNKSAFIRLFGTSNQFIMNQNGNAAVGTVSTPLAPWQIQRTGANCKMMITDGFGGDGNYRHCIWTQVSGGNPAANLVDIQVSDGSTTGLNTVGRFSGEGRLLILGDDNSNLAVGDGGQLIIAGRTTPSIKMQIGMNTTGQYGFIQPVQSGVAFRNLSLVPINGSLGIGTTTPTFRFTIASSTGGVNMFSIGNGGEIITGGTVPTTSSCGTNTIGGNNTAGTVNISAGAPTSCTVTFSGSAKTRPYSVVVTGRNNVTYYVSATSTTAFTVTGSATINGFSYIVNEY